MAGGQDVAAAFTQDAQVVYDLPAHLLDAAEEVDEEKFGTLMDLRADFGESDGQDETNAVRLAFEAWEVSNA